MKWVVFLSLNSNRKIANWSVLREVSNDELFNLKPYLEDAGEESGSDSGSESESE